MNIITISREFGSGGRELGRRLAAHLGVAYYDNEILTELAKSSNLDEAYLSNVADSGDIHFTMPLTSARAFSRVPLTKSQDAELLGKQSKIIKRLAEKGDCVVVGRSADCLLAKHHPFRLFVYANLASKMARCRDRASAGEVLTDKELERKIKDIDNARRNNYEMVSSRRWGDKEGYDLCINTSYIDVANFVEVVAAYSRLFFKGGQ